MLDVRTSLVADSPGPPVASRDGRPTDFDLVLTLQGSHVQPYLEEGELSTPEAWDELTQVFQGQFFGFAI